MKFRDWLVDQQVCPEVIKWVEDHNITTFRQMWDQAEDTAHLFYGLRHSPHPLAKEQAVTLAITFASHVEQTTAEGKEALACAKRWLAEPTEENRLACQKAASRAAADAAWAAAWAAAAANAADAARAAWAAWAADAAWAAADERKWQVRQIKKMFPDPWSGK